MSSGDRFLKQKQNDFGHPFQEVTINRQTLVDITAAWLYAARQVNEAKDITNIQFSDLFGSSDQEFVTLKVTTGGNTKQANG